jgi:primosomal protein N'
MTKEKITATWRLGLMANCPGCSERVDLLDYEDFWDGMPCDPCEHHTPRTTNMEVVCPECGHEFQVTTEL